VGAEVTVFGPVAGAPEVAHSVKAKARIHLRMKVDLNKGISLEISNVFDFAV